MTRRSREESKSRLYHIMVCGNNREAVFYAEKEKLRFLRKPAGYRRGGKSPFRQGHTQ